MANPSNLIADGVRALVPREAMTPAARKLRDSYAITPGAPFFHRTFGFWMCLDAWKQQGLPTTDLATLFHLDPPGNHSLGQLGWCEAAFRPAFPERLIQDRGDTEVVQDTAGRHVLFFKGRRQGFMPEYVGHPVRDPHGDAIPEPGGALPADSGQPLNALPPDAPGVIAHIEDEPRAIFAQLSAQGLRPGMKACVIEKDPHHVRFWADGREHVLPPTLANNIFVVPLPEVEARALFGEEFLVGLKAGQHAKVLGLSPACRGVERRRLLDLGFVAGTAVEVEMVSPGGDPTAYRVRGTLIALRREQANLIRITTAPEVAAA
jgi:Fe2+ transport system protein FeoA